MLRSAGDMAARTAPSNTLASTAETRLELATLRTTACRPKRASVRRWWRGARLRAAESSTGVQPGASGIAARPEHAAGLVVVVAGRPAGAQVPDLQRVQRGVAAVGEQLDPVTVGIGEDLVGDNAAAAVGE